MALVLAAQRHADAAAEKRVERQGACLKGFLLDTYDLVLFSPACLARSAQRAV